MKFNAVVGNPPYHKRDGGGQSSAVAMYHHFVRAAKSLDPDYFSLVVPSRWYSGGRGLDEFRSEMVNDCHIEMLHDFPSAEQLFPSANIRGGVCYFLWNKNHDNIKDSVRVVTYRNGEVESDVSRKLLYYGMDVFIRDYRGIEILSNVVDDSFTPLSQCTSTQKPFGFRGTFVDDERFKKSPVGLKKPIGCQGKKGLFGYVERNIVAKNTHWIDNWKVFMPLANDVGMNTTNDNVNVIIGKPGVICTESFVVIGADLGLSKDEAGNLSKYLTTKFARYLHGLMKINPLVSVKTMTLVPTQDFSNSSDIDWSLSVSEVDRQLYCRYGLSDSQISYIESSVKDM